MCRGIVVRDRDGGIPLFFISFVRERQVFFQSLNEK